MYPFLLWCFQTFCTLCLLIFYTQRFADLVQNCVKRDNVTIRQEIFGALVGLVIFYAYLVMSWWAFLSWIKTF